MVEHEMLLELLRSIDGRLERMEGAIVRHDERLRVSEVSLGRVYATAGTLSAIVSALWAWAAHAFTTRGAP